LLIKIADYGLLIADFDKCECLNNVDHF